VRRAALRSGVSALRDLGYEVRLGRHVLARQGYLAGDDDRRAEDLCAALSDPDLAAVWFARGGYGTARILERLPWAQLKRRPKLCIGYSDLTALFNPLVERTGARCIYGPVVSELGDPAAFDAAALWPLLAGEPPSLRLRRRDVLQPGRARGRVMGGNLSVLAHLVGTPFAPRLDGCMLFLEETGEEVYRIDRLLTQLRQAGAFDGLAAVLLGRFLVRRRSHFPPDRRLLDVLRESFLPLGVPVVRGLDVGHGPSKRVLPLGQVARLDTEAARLEFGP
jgi:muramoyltetrapeptide carboxypeptidase